MTVKETLIRAIDDRHTVRILYKEAERVIDPYVLYETRSGSEVLHGWQTEGVYETSPPPKWCNLKVDDISDVALVGEYKETHRGYNPQSSQFHRIIRAVKVSSPRLFLVKSSRSNG